jgi:hypothetical protein
MTPAEFIAKYASLKGTGERGNYQMFFTELCHLLGVPTPNAKDGNKLGDYQFEGPVKSEAVFGGKSAKSIDLYKRNCFILEAKQSQEGYADSSAPDDDALETVTDLFGNAIGTAARSGKRKPRYDRFMADARLQAERYAHGLPDDHKSPPFLIVADIGRSFELYFDYGGNGRGYRFYPDQQSYRIPFADLAEERVRDLLRDIWTTPEARDPTRIAADVTRDIAHRLAAVGKFLEAEERRRDADVSSLRTEATALFLMRILFCMFAEDVGLLPENSFKSLLEDAEKKSPEWWRSQLDSLWKAMDSPDRENRYWVHADHRLRHFNGNLFSNRQVFELDSGMIGHLIAAARCNWRAVEPAIFGTLLEQVLEGTDRAKLGAHYTPRAYVQRLVNATISEVIDAEWAEARDTVDRAVAAGDDAAAVATVTAFHRRLAALRILDPACGTGNFLYVALEYLLRLESEVIELAAGLGTTLTPAVHPRQLLGLELNERAAVIAELVLWIGWLRHRLANHPDAVDDPVLPTLDTINFGTHGGYDAVLRRTETKEPDIANPMVPDWPEADFIIGNPPFIGKGALMRAALGDDYVEALRRANPRVPPSADFVMQWWDRAAHILTAENSPLIRFGFVTTNSITQTFSRRVIENYLAPPPPSPPSPLAGEERDLTTKAFSRSGEGAATPATGQDDGAQARRDPSPDSSGHPLAQGERGLSLILAIPDHPWTKATPDAAAVRIAMTVAAPGQHDGRLIEITGEHGLDSDNPMLIERVSRGRINPDLQVGADITSVSPLKANAGMSSNGMMLAGQGFKLSAQLANTLINSDGEAARAVIRPYLGGSELVRGSRRNFAIDFFGLSEKEARHQYPTSYGHLLTSVKPERDKNRDRHLRENWWIFGRTRVDFRPALQNICRYIATVETSKHRLFQFLEAQILPDHMIVAIASDDAFHLGVLSADIHLQWALQTGGWLGVGNDSRYSKSRVFDPFPFPDPTPEQRAAIADLAEELDTTRKAVLAENERLTMTELYNLREAIRSGTTDEDVIRRARNARAGIVDQLHQRLDAEVAAAYGWPADLPPAEIVARLVALNAKRAAEEAAGHIRWLRPDYQRPRFAPAATGG